MTKSINLFFPLRWGAICIILSLLMQGCFTGIENTGHISEKDVSKVKADRKSPEELFMDSIVPFGFRQWKPGKRFYVNDNNIRLILTPSENYNLDSLNLKGDTLIYIGYRFVRQIDNKEDIAIRFSDGKREYIYDTGKTIDAIENERPEYIAPFLTDLDFVAEAKRHLVGKRLFIKTPLWQDSTGRSVKGRHYVPVLIDDVTAGDVVYPFRVVFDYDGKKSCVYMSSQSSSVKNMTFDKLFSLSDIRANYKVITDSNWESITRGKIVANMTKEECSLALGAPRTIDRMGTHGGMYERWSYDNGVFLIFDNGILVQFRQ